MNAICALALCTGIITTEPMKESTRVVKETACVELVQKASEVGHDEFIIIAIAHTESRFNKNAVSKAGAVGIMQILPKYFCPKKGPCNYTEAGFRAWEAWSRNRTMKESLCRYNSGRPCSESARARHYSYVVIKKYKALRAMFSDSADCVPGC